MGKSKKVLTVVVLCFMLLLSKNFKEGRQTSDSGDSKETNTFKSVFLEKKELELYPPGIADGGVSSETKATDGDIFSILERFGVLVKNDY